MRSQHRQPVEKLQQRNQKLRRFSRQWGNEGDRPQIDIPAPEKPFEFDLSDRTGVRIGRIIIPKVIPEYISSGFKNALHFVDDPSSHIFVRDRRQNSKLAYQIETFGTDRKLSRGSVYRLYVASQFASFFHSPLQQIRAETTLSLNSKADQFLGPKQPAASHIQCLDSLRIDAVQKIADRFSEFYEVKLVAGIIEPIALAETLAVLWRSL